jgi:hypothetical protein
MNIDWIDYKYINLLSSRLELFRKRSENLYNFRCPICGDSKKNRFKTRGFIFQKDSGFVFHCHNCGDTKRFGDFLNFVDTTLYNDYRHELYMEKHAGGRLRKTHRTIFDFKDDFHKNVKAFNSEVFKGLTPVSELRRDHFCLAYVRKRKIPEKVYPELYFAPKFMTFINSVVQDKFDAKLLEDDHPRLVVPFLGRDGKVAGITGRDLTGVQKAKYSAIVFDENVPYIYGYNKVDLNKDVMVFEGPIDAMFIENSIGLGSAHFDGIDKYIDKDRLIIVLDNEPRNADIVRRVRNAITKNFRVALYPDYITQKDINEMVLAGYAAESLKDVLLQNTFRGLEAELRFNGWKRTS